MVYAFLQDFFVFQTSSRHQSAQLKKQPLGPLGEVLQDLRAGWTPRTAPVWVAGHRWCYLMAAIDCCTREIVAWQLELRRRAEEAIDLLERAAASTGSTSASRRSAPTTDRGEEEEP